MKTRQQHLSTVAVLAAAVLTISACSGSSQISGPADIDRPDLEVELYNGAACDSIPQEVVDRYAPEMKPHSFDPKDVLDLREQHSACVWATGDPSLIVSDTHEYDGTVIFVSIDGFNYPVLARERYDDLYDFSFLPDGTVENGLEHGPVHEIAIGDQGVAQHRERLEGDGPAAGQGYAVFVAGNHLVEIFISRGVADPWNEDEVLAALSNIVAAFGKGEFSPHL